MSNPIKCPMCTSANTIAHAACNVCGHHWQPQADPRLARLREALQSLMDEQNGPPLLGHRHEAAWKTAMDEAQDALEATNAK